MRNLMFTTAAVLVLVPASAWAAQDTNETTRTETYKTERTVRSIHDFNQSPGRAIFDLEGGQQLIIEEQAAYKVDPDGYTYFAPTSEYKTASGYTVVVENGLFHHIEEPMADSLYLEHRPERSDELNIRRPEEITPR
jgi:hypothetical protein